MSKKAKTIENMKLYMKKIFTILPVLALVLSVSACREEPDPGTVPTRLHVQDLTGTYLHD